MKRITFNDLGKEPFRIFFAEGVFAGILGVSLWPLYFCKVTEFYPGQAHARIMAYGLFGAFIFGFLGTAMPRLLSAPPLGTRNVFVLFALHFWMILAFAAQNFFLGDTLFLLLLLLFIMLMVLRARHRKDTPPPGFVLVLLAFVCVLAGAIIALFESRMEETATFWITLQRRLSYQGFVLLPILGIGPFILPRFFGLPNPHDFPETISPAPAWKRKATLAAVVGLLIVVSFFIESKGWLRTAHLVRSGAIVFYLVIEFPFRLAPKISNALGLSLRIAFLALVGGFVFIIAFPTFRVGFLHLTLIGGFAVITFTVATRVIFGHSGQLERLKGKNRWLLVSIGLMLFGMATRISGDFWPNIMGSHYSYGAIIWTTGVLLWCFYALPKVLQIETD